MDITPEGAGDLVRGVTPIILGLLLLAFAPGRRAALFLGGALLLGGVQFLAAWIHPEIPDRVIGRGLDLLAWDIGYFPQAFVLSFLLVFPAPFEVVKRRPWLAWSPIMLASVYTVVSLVSPDIFRISWSGGVTTTETSYWLFASVETWLVAAPIALIVARHRLLPPGPARSDFALVGLGLTASALVYWGFQLFEPILASATGDPCCAMEVWRERTGVRGFLRSAGVWMIVGSMAALVAIPLARMRREPPEARGADRLLAYGAIALVAAGVLQWIVAQVTAPILFWSLAVPVGAALATFGVIRVEILSNPLRRAVAFTAAGTALGLVYLGLLAGLSGGTSGSPTAVATVQVVSIAAVGALALPFTKLARNLSSPAQGLVAEDDRARRIQVYRAALEDVLEREPETPTPTSQRLARLRAELGLSEREHEVVLHFLRERKLGTGAPTLEAGATFLGRYRIERALGSGGFGETWLAIDERLGRNVAIKALHGVAANEADRRRFAREMRALAALRHPNVVTLHDVEEVGGHVFLIMEYASGGSLRSALAERGPLAPDALRRLARETLAALEAIHAANLAHGDIKPSNILLEGEKAMIADFGAARRVRAPDAGATASGLATESGGPMGTLRYAAPEQVAGGQGDARSDLYSLGATLVEAATGATYLPFHGVSEFEARRMILATEPELSKVPDAELRAWLAQALEKSPEKRWRSVREAREALDARVAV